MICWKGKLCDTFNENAVSLDSLKLSTNLKQEKKQEKCSRNTAYATIKVNTTFHNALAKTGRNNMLYTYNEKRSERQATLYCLNYGFYWYVVDKFKCAYFRSVSRKHCFDFINGMANKNELPAIIERLT